MLTFNRSISQLSSIILCVCVCVCVILSILFSFFFFFFCGTRASHCCGFSPCRAQAPDAQAQRPWLMGPAAPRYVGSSWTGARTRVPCIGRRTLNHCTTREVPSTRSCFSSTRFLIGPPILIEDFLYAWYCAYQFTFLINHSQPLS